MLWRGLSLTEQLVFLLLGRLTIRHPAGIKVSKQDIGLEDKKGIAMKIAKITGKEFLQHQKY